MYSEYSLPTLVGYIQKVYQGIPSSHFRNALLIIPAPLPLQIFQFAEEGYDYLSE